MTLGLSEVVAAFDDGAAEVVYDSNGPFGTVQSSTPVAVASFTIPRAGHVIATMWFTPGSNTTVSSTRGLAVEVGGSRVGAQLSYTSDTHILSCYGDLPAGEATILVNCGSGFSSAATTPTRIRVITWSD